MQDTLNQPMKKSEKILFSTVLAKELVSLRKTILRPDDIDAQRCHYSGDDDCTSKHLIAFDDSKQVGMATLIRDPKDFDEHGMVSWRIRGVGVLESHRRQGIASALVEALLVQVDQTNEASWLSGRVSQRSLYERLGFVVVSDVYEIVGTGPHFDFVRRPQRAT
jgi:GNAT superfamily N-acetyltransferase